MSLFKCSSCGCVENTAVSHYATRPEGSPALCSECDPTIGKWHGRFEKRPADPDYVEDQYGHLITREESAQQKQAEEFAKGVNTVKHIGLEGVAKHYFVAGWNAAMRWHKREKGN